MLEILQAKCPSHTLSNGSVAMNDAVIDFEVMKVDVHSVVVIAKTFEKYSGNRNDENGPVPSDE